MNMCINIHEGDAHCALEGTQCGSRYFNIFQRSGPFLDCLLATSSWNLVALHMDALALSMPGKLMALRTRIILYCLNANLMLLKCIALSAISSSRSLFLSLFLCLFSFSLSFFLQINYYCINKFSIFSPYSLIHNNIDLWIYNITKRAFFKVS